MESKHLFKVPGPYLNEAGIKYVLSGVNNEEELEEALDNGWHEDINDAVLECIEDGFGPEAFRSIKYSKAWKKKMVANEENTKKKAEALAKKEADDKKAIAKARAEMKAELKKELAAEAKKAEAKKVQDKEEPKKKVQDKEEPKKEFANN